MSQIPWIEQDELWFPPVDQALDDPDGLLAAGGDLSAERLLLAYRNGIFPWFDDQQPILWWSPDPRCILRPDELHVSRSLRKLIRQQRYQVSFDRCFEQVMAACSEPRPDQPGTWITTEMKEAYQQLHRQGVAHSVEVWNQKQLVGGLYGLAIGKLFFGESMFSRAANASKVGFVHLVEQLKLWDYALIDCQVDSDHLATLGASSIPRHQFIQILRDHIDLPSPSNWNQISLPEPLL